MSPFHSEFVGGPVDGLSCTTIFAPRSGEITYVTSLFGFTHAYVFRAEGYRPPAWRHAGVSKPVTPRGQDAKHR